MIACVREGAHVVSFADELGEEFAADPDLSPRTASTQARKATSG